MFGIAGWRVREAGLADVDALSLVGTATFLETYAGLTGRADMLDFCAAQHGPDRYRRYLAEGARAWLGEAEHTEAPLGYALTCAPEIDLAGPGDVELKRIYALTRMQGTGLGRALLDAAIAGSAGFRRLLLGTNAGNIQALAFYERHGFARIGTRAFRVGSVEHHDFVLARDLAPARAAC